MLDKQTTRGAAVMAALLFGGALVAHRTYFSPEQGSEIRFQRDTLELVTASGSRRIDIELAVTPSEQSQGLMYRTNLPDTQGMLFVHKQPADVRMWMRNTYIPLDMVFIRKDGTVHRIAAMTEPLSDTVIASDGEVAAVLELNGGASVRFGLKVGDKVRHAHFR
jgi:hypothetical protein